MAGLTWDQVVDYFKRFGAGGTGRAIGPNETLGAQYWIGRNPTELQSALLKEPKPAGGTGKAPIDVNAQLMKGPTHYPTYVRKNLGMDIQMGGKQPTSGMTQSAPMPAVTGYQPVAAKPDPVIPLIKMMFGK